MKLAGSFVTAESSCRGKSWPVQNTCLHGSAVGKRLPPSQAIIPECEVVKSFRAWQVHVFQDEAAACTASLTLLVRSRHQRRRRSCLHAASGDAAKSTESERVIEDLRDTVRRLEAEREQLKRELSQSRLDDSEPTKGALGLGQGAGADWPFRYPTADLSWPVESVRVAAPGQSTGTTAYGDWLPLFRSAAPYIAAYQGGIVVVHVPSNMLDDENQEAFKGLMEDLAFCSLLGMRLVVVTSIMTRVCRRLGMTRCSEMEPADQPTMVVDEETLRIAKQEAGLARVEVEGALSAGFEKRSTSGMGGGATPASHGTFSLRSSVSVVSSANFFTASPVGVRSGVDYQYAGVVRSVNTDVLERRLSDGDIVSLTPLGTSPSGEVFFVDSELLAARVASKLRAIKLVYITQGARLIDSRSGRIIPGVQKRNVQDLLKHLAGGALATEYSEAVRSSEWFQDFLRSLRFLVDVVSPTGVRRGHLVDPTPGALLQEFYTTDGSGTVIAQDLYQGLGCAQVADAGRIMKLLEEDAERFGLPNEVSSDFVEGSCARGEFFVWKRDGSVLGCARLVPLRTQLATPPKVLTQIADDSRQVESNPPVDSNLFAELHCMAVAEDCFDTHATAFFGYAQRAAIEGRASALLASPGRDAKRLTWLQGQGFRKPTALELKSLPTTCQTKDSILLLPFNECSVQDADACLTDFAEQQRMWGGLA